MTHHFCTYFNSGYLDRALALLNSMRHHLPSFTLEILCFDDATYDFFQKNKFAEVICQRLVEFEKRNPDVLAVKQERSKAEYFFTCTPAWIYDVMLRSKRQAIVTYLDADLFFFSSPESVFKEFEGKDILITEHGFPPSDKTNLRFGRFNVGWLSFRNSQAGIACLKRWRRQCIEWCFDRLEDDKFADQKYLDEWPQLYGDKLLIAQPGLNTGPWSLCKDQLRSYDGAPYLSSHPLIVYHFQGLRLFSARHFYLGHYFKFNPCMILQLLYFPYVKQLLEIAELYQLESAGAQQRYAKGGWLYRMITGYWVDRPGLSCIIWWIQRHLFRC